MYLLLLLAGAGPVPAANLREPAEELARALSTRDLPALRAGAEAKGPLADLFALHAATLLHEQGGNEPGLVLLDSIPPGPTRARADRLRVRMLASIASPGPGAPKPEVPVGEPGDIDLADEHLRAGRRTEAARILMALVLRAPRTIGSRAAIERLERLYRARRFLPVPSRPADLLAFGDALFEHREHALALEVVERVIRSPKVSTQLERAKAELLVGKVHDRRRHHPQAAAAFHRASLLFDRTSPERAESLYRRGESLLLAGDLPRAKEAYQGALVLGGNFAAGSLWQLAEIDRRNGDRASRKSRLGQIVARHGLSRFASKAAWTLAAEDEAAGRFAEAKDGFLDFTSRFPGHRLANAARFRAGENAFRGKAVLTARRLWTEALELPAVPDLFSLFSAQRLAGVEEVSFRERRGPGWDLFLGRIPSQASMRPIWVPPGPEIQGIARDRVEALEAVGLYEDLAHELEHHTAGSASPSFATRAARVFALANAGRPREAIVLFASVPRPPAEPVILESAFFSGLFPRGYSREIEAGAKQHEVAPELAFAIAREESHFDPGCQSWSDARGLMQILPSTARWIAEVRRMPPVRDLYQPAANADLGAWYLTHLLEMFQDDPEPELVAIAAYNGGPGWARRSRAGLPAGHSFLDFLDAMDRDETREYVWKVTRSLLMYEALAAREIGHTARRPDPASPPVPSDGSSGEAVAGI